MVASKPDIGLSILGISSQEEDGIIFTDCPRSCSCLLCSLSFIYSIVELFHGLCQVRGFIIW